MGRPIAPSPMNPTESATVCTPAGIVPGPRARPIQIREVLPNA